MRPLLSFTILTGLAVSLSGCGEGAAMKNDKTASLSGRQEVAMRLALATEAAGDFPGAEKLFLQVATQAPEAPQPQIELAEFYKRHREDAKAVDTLTAALKFHPDDTDLERELANTYIGEAEPEKALPVLNRAIAANPRDALLYNSRGVALDQTGSYHEAQVSYRQAYNLDPAEGMMYKVNISMSYILSGSYDKAIALLRPVLDAPDAPPIIRQNLALAYGLKGESANALKLGLEDLSESEAAENVRFYRMLAHKHGSVTHERQTGSATTGSATVPASVVKDLFPEEEPAQVSSVPDGVAPAPVLAHEAPVAPMMKANPPKAEIEPLKPQAANKSSENDQEAIPSPVLRSDLQPFSAMSPSAGEPVPAPVPVMARDNDALPLPVLKPDMH